MASRVILDVFFVALNPSTIKESQFQPCGTDENQIEIHHGLDRHTDIDIDVDSSH